MKGLRVFLRRDAPVFVTFGDLAGRAFGIVGVLLSARIAATSRDFAALVLLSSALILLVPILRLGTPLILVRAAGGALARGERDAAAMHCRAALNLSALAAGTLLLLCLTPLAAPVLDAALPVEVGGVTPALIGLWVGAELIRSTIADCLRGLNRFRMQAVAGEGGRALGVTLVLGVLWLGDERVSVETLISLNLAANVVAVALGLVGLTPVGFFGKRVRVRWLSYAGLVGPGLALLASIGGTWVVNQGDIWVVNSLENPSAVATYGIAVRLAGLLALPLAFAANVGGPIVAGILQDRDATARFLSGLAAGTAIGALFLYTGVALIIPQFLAGFTGSGYEDATPLLLILGIGQVVNSVTGACGLALVMHGRERAVAKAGAAWAVATLLLEIALGSAFGVTGVAGASAAGTAGLNLTYLGLCRRLLLLNLLPRMSHLGFAARAVTSGLSGPRSPGAPVEEG